MKIQRHNIIIDFVSWFFVSLPFCIYLFYIYLKADDPGTAAGLAVFMGIIFAVFSSIIITYFWRFVFDLKQEAQTPKTPKAPEGPFSRPDFDFMKKFYRYVPIAFLVLTPIFFLQNPPREIIDWFILPVSGFIMAMFVAGTLLVVEVIFLRSSQLYREGYRPWMIFHPLFLLPIIKITAFIAVLMAILFFNENQRIALGIILFGSGLYGLTANLLTYYRKKMAKK